MCACRCRPFLFDSFLVQICKTRTTLVREVGGGEQSITFRILGPWLAEHIPMWASSEPSYRGNKKQRTKSRIVALLSASFLLTIPFVQSFSFPASQQFFFCLYSPVDLSATPLLVRRPVRKKTMEWERRATTFKSCAGPLGTASRPVPALDPEAGGSSSVSRPLRSKPRKQPMSSAIPSA